MFFECQKTFQNLFPKIFNPCGNVNRALPKLQPTSDTIRATRYERQDTSYKRQATDF